MLRTFLTPVIGYLSQSVRLFFRAPQQVAVWSFVRHYADWKRSLRKDTNSLGEGEPWLTFPARDFLNRAIRPGMSVFEYGTGGSSVFFLKHGARLVSVEHDRGWADRVRQEIQSPMSDQWKLLHISPEPGGRGNPEKPEDCVSAHPAYAQRSFRKYAASIDAYPDESFDIVLVDGRARPSCYQHAQSKIKPGGMLILDNSERPRYHFVHEDLQSRDWKRRCFPGPGPYGRKFWETTVWRKPIKN